VRLQAANGSAARLQMDLLMFKPPSLISRLGAPEPGHGPKRKTKVHPKGSGRSS
jgi:hypothetical protein